MAMCDGLHEIQRIQPVQFSLFRDLIRLRMDISCDYLAIISDSSARLSLFSLLLFLIFRPTNNKDINNKKTKGMVNTIDEIYSVFVFFFFFRVQIHYSFIVFSCSCFVFR